MCGIAGFCLSPNDHNINARKLARHLLLGIEERGKDATGAAWRNRHGDLVMQKRDWTATGFVPTLALDKQARLAILHTRMWTQGSPANNLNNHPIVAGDIIGVHNGTLSNDRDLLKMAAKHGYERRAEVDSEAIFAMLDLVDDNDKSFTLEDALEAPEARMAVAWIDQQDTHNGILHLARGDGSPLVVGQSEAGSLVFASTKKALTAAADACGLLLPYIKDVDEGTYYRVKDGIIVEKRMFCPTPSWNYYTSGTSAYSGTATKTTTTKTGNAVTANHNTSYLDMRYLDDSTEVELMAASVFQNAYKSRVLAVGAWMDDHSFFDDVTGELNTEHAIFSKAAERGAFLRPGMWVTTWVAGECCAAQVYRLPKSFPEGDYILRVLVPEYDVDAKHTGVEPVFLARTIDNIDGPDLYWNDGTDNAKEEATPLAELTA